MPKKRSVKTWRKSETGEEFRTTVEESIHQEALEKESNENLFFIDTGGMCAGWIGQVMWTIGNEKTKKKLIDEDENRGLTKYEQAKIEKLVEQKKNAVSTLFVCWDHRCRASQRPKLKRSKFLIYGISQ